MRKLLIIIFLCFCAASFCSARHPSGEDSDLDTALEWRKLDRGAQLASSPVTLFGRKQYISVLRYPAGKFRTDIANDPGVNNPRWPESPKAINPESPAATTSGFAVRYGAFAAINGSYFNMRTLYPAGYVLDDGVEEGDVPGTDLVVVDGILAIKKHKVDIFRADTASYSHRMKGYCDAFAAGPVLIEGGKVLGGWPETSFFTGHHQRTVVGTKGKWVYFVVIDGRFPEYADGMSMDETAAVASMLGLENAINLDGGGSSTLWTTSGGVINHPGDNRKWDHEGERTVCNAVIIK